MKKFLYQIFGLALLALPALAKAADSLGLDATATNAGFRTDLTPEGIVGIAIKSVLGFLGLIGFALVIYAGFLWMTAAGNPKQVDQAKQIMFDSLIGIVIIFLSYAITDFVINAIAIALQ